MRAFLSDGTQAELIGRPGFLVSTLSLRLVPKTIGTFYLNAEALDACGNHPVTGLVRRVTVR